MRVHEETTQREQQFMGMCNKFKHQLHQSKKTIETKDNIINQLQSENKKVQNINYQFQDEMENLKMEMKKNCERYECSLKKSKYDSDGEICKLERFIRELKDSIEELMDVKNHLMDENRKLLGILRKKQQQQRHRKQLLRTQLKEIDRIEKVIDKIH